MKCPHCLKEFNTTPDTTREPYYYDGYLKDYLPTICAGFKNGLSPAKIAIAIEQPNASTMIRYIGKRYGWRAPNNVLVDLEYQKARREHAWLLRCEGFKLREISNRLGIGRERARQMINKFSREMTRSLKRTKIRKISTHANNICP